jgi:hypothetical protein
VDEALAAAGPCTERFPNGEERRLARLSRMFPGAAARTTPRLGAFVFLTGIGDRAALAPAPPGAESARRLAPLAATLWDLPPALRTLRLLQTLSLAPAFTMTASTPDAAVDLLASELRACPA